MPNKTKRQREMEQYAPGESRPDIFRRDGFRHAYVDVARTMSAAGFTSAVELAARFNVTATTIGRWKERFPSFREAIDGGHVEMVAELTHRMLELSREGSESATRFLLERRVDTFKPASKIDHSGKIEGMSEMLARRISTEELVAQGILTDDEK